MTHIPVTLTDTFVSPYKKMLGQNLKIITAFTYSNFVFIIALILNAT